MIPSLSAVVYAILMGFVAAFQGCLALGMPWGSASMGGKFPGRYPPKMRIAAMVNMIVASLLMVIVLIHAGMLFPHLQSISKYAIWFVAGFSALSVVLNSISSSKIERYIWIPVTSVQLVTSIIVALQ